MAKTFDPTQRTGELLRSLFEATAGETGDDFFRALVKQLAELLESRHAFISELLPSGKRARALAYWADGRFLEPFEYDLSNSPCETVLGGNIVHVPEKLLARYPNDKILARLGFESYLGIPLVSREGEVLGHVAATDDKPMLDKSRDYSTFEVFASRVTAELERRRADAALARVQAKLLQAEKLVSLGQLTAGVAHEINTPAGIIQSYADLSKRLLERLRGSLSEAAWSAESEKYFSTLVEATEASSVASRRIAGIVSNLKKFTRVDTSEYQETDIRDCIESTLALLKPRLPEGVAIDREYGVVPKIHSHPAELNQVFMTLLQNAIDAVDGEGNITVTTASDEENVYATVADDGPGIPREILDDLFEIGFSAKDARIRMRVGLSTAYDIIKNHDGDISVARGEDRGTKFTITLPIHRG
jgi:signal transduction histidine kinase